MNKDTCCMCGKDSANLIYRNNGDVYCKDCHASNCEHINTETIPVPGTDETVSICHDCGYAI